MKTILPIKFSDIREDDIEKIYVKIAPDSRWVDGVEIVLTNGVSVEFDGYAMKEIIRKYNEHTRTCPKCRAFIQVVTFPKENGMRDCCCQCDWKGDWIQGMNADGTSQWKGPVKP